MKKIFVFVIILLPIISFSQLKNSRELTLDDCLKMAMDNNHSLKVSEARMQSSESKFLESKTYALPSLKFSGAYSRLSDIDPFKIDLPAPISKSVTLSPVLLNNTNLRISLQQPVFTGSKISGSIDAADFGFQSSVEEYKKEKNDLITNVKIAYLNIVKANRLLENINENIRQTENHLKDINNFLATGQLTRNDLLKSEVKLYSLKASSIEAENMIAVSKLNLGNIIGVGSDFSISSYDLKTVEQKMENLDYYVNKAISNRSELKSLDNKLKMAGAGINVAASNWYPQIFFNANYTYANPNSRIMPAQDKFIDTWDVGITLSFDLWNWGSAKHKVEQADAQYREIKSGLDQYHDYIILEVTQIYLNMKQLKESIVFLNKAVEQAEENYKISKEKFEKGFLSSSELFDAETALFTAKNNLCNADIEYGISAAKLERAAGILKN